MIEKIAILEHCQKYESQYSDDSDDRTKEVVVFQNENTNEITT